MISFNGYTVKQPRQNIIISFTTSTRKCKVFPELKSVRREGKEKKIILLTFNFCQEKKIRIETHFENVTHTLERNMRWENFSYELATFHFICNDLENGAFQ